MKLSEIIKICEYNKDYILKNYSKTVNNIVKNKEKDINSLNELLEKLDHYIIKNYDNNIRKTLDPYIKWIIDKYSKNRIENFNEIVNIIIPNLLIFDKIKTAKKLPENIPYDINKIEDPKELKNIATEISKIKTKRVEYKEKESNLFAKGSADLIYEDDKLKIVKINDINASCFYGINTKWCTAMTDDNYNKETAKNYLKKYLSIGNLYVIFDKKNKSKYQISFAAKKIRDEKDKIVNPLKFREINPYVYDKLIELFKDEIVDNRYFEFMQNDFETLYDKSYILNLIKREFFENNQSYDTSILLHFVEGLKNIQKIDVDKSTKILELFSEVLENMFKNKESADLDIHKIYSNFLILLKNNNIIVPIKFKNILEKILQKYSKENTYLPKFYFSNLKNLILL